MLIPCMLAYMETALLRLLRAWSVLPVSMRVCAVALQRAPPPPQGLGRAPPPPQGLGRAAMRDISRRGIESDTSGGGMLATLHRTAHKGTGG